MTLIKITVDAYAKGASAWFCKKDVKQGKAAIGRRRAPG